MKKFLFLTFALFCLTIGLKAQQYLLQEGFEGTELPTGWTLIDNDGDGNNWYVLNNSQSSSGGFVVHSGQGHITSASYASVALTPDNWLITPAVTLNSAAVLSFWVAGQDQAWAAEHFSVYLSTTGTTVADFTTTLLYDQVATGTMTQYTVYLTQYTGQTVYIAFRHHNISDMFRLNLDDVEITEAPTTATIEATPTSIDFYTAIGTPVSSTVNVNAINLTDAITATTAAPYSVSTDSINFGTTATLGTTGGTLYVQYNPTTVGTDSDMITLSSTGATNVDIALNGRAIVMGSIPFTQDFEDDNENASWCFYHNGVNQWNIGTALNTTDGGSNALYISNDNGLTNYYDVNSASTSWAYRDIDFGNYQEYNLTFNMKNMGQSTSYDYLKIYLGPPAQVQNTASSTGSTLQGAALVGSWANIDTWTPVSVNIPSSFSGIQRLYLLWWNDASSGTNPPAAIDDIVITGSNCGSPTQFTVTGNASTTVSLSWQGNSGALNYNIAYGPSGFTLDDNSDIETTQDTAITLTELTTGQTYDFYVRTDCGGEVSAWRGPITATPGSINIGTTGSGSITACSTVIYDDGGMNGTYSNSCNYTLTIYPSEPDALVSVSGTFAGEGTIDYLSIYNGTSTSADSLIQKITSGTSGAVVNFGPLTSDVGPLTLLFYSDGSVVYDGFELTVSCVAIPDCSPAENLTISDIAGSSALISWENGHFGTVSSYTLEYTEAGMDNWINVSSNITDNSYLLSGLDPQTGYQVRVSVNCDEGESDWIEESFVTRCLAGGEINIGNGTSTSYQIPLNTYYNYTYTEQIFLSSEMNGASILNSVSFDYHYTTAISAKNNVDIYLKHTTQSSFSSTSDYIDTAGAQLVYHGALNCQQGWNTFNFTAPFQYNGTDNLVLIVDDNSGAYNSSSCTFNVHDAGATRSLYYYSDSYNPEPGNLAGYSGSKYTTTNRNNVIFGGNCDESVTCIAPNMFVNNISTNSVDISWVQGYNENSWEMEYTLYGDSAWIPVANVSGGTVTIDQLSANTHYMVRMRSVCAPGDESIWVMRDFRTECGALTLLPFSENFDSYGTGTTVYPDCWSKISTNTSNNCPYITTTNNSAPGSLYFYTGTSGTYSMAITPEFDASIPINTLQASFMYRASNSSDKLIVGVISDPDNASTFVPVDTVYPDATAANWVEKIVFFNQYTDDGQYIAFKNAYTTTSAYAYIDNLVIELIPSCPKPTSLTAASGASDSVTLSWTDPNGTLWDIIYGPTGFNPETSTEAISILGITENPYIVSGLTGGTIYDFYVRTDCGGGDVSPWCSIPAAAAPYTIQMGISGSDVITGCDFTVTDDGGTNGNYSNSCNYTLTIYPSDQNSLVSISGTFAGESSLDYLSVYEGTTTTADNLILKIYSTMNGGSSGNVVSFGPLTSDAGPMTLLFHSDGSVVYPGFVATVSCVPAPTCRKPINLTASGASQNSVTLSWTAMGDETDWDIIYGTPGFNPENEGTLIQNVNSNPYTLTGLTALTPYEVYVRANCGGSDVSDWIATPVSFNTAGCDVSDQCQYVIDCADSYGDGWNGAAVTVQQNGVTIATVTINSGSSGSETIMLCDNVPSALIWTSGSYDSECSFTLTDPTGTVIYTSSSLSSGSLFTFTTSCSGSTPTTCNEPTNLSATATAYNAATVTWTAGGSETSWNLQYKTSSASSWSNSISVYTTSYSLSGLTAETAYQVRVQAVCDNYETSTWTTAASFTTPAMPTNPCNAPTALTVTNVTTNSATINWTPGGSETSWKVSYKTNTATQWQEVAVQQPTYEIAGLSAATAYDVRVKAVCAANNESDFTTANFTTQTVGIDNINLANSINLLPNPADNYIDLSVNSNVEVKEAVVYNAFGQMIQTVELTDNHARIDLNNMASGMYFVRVNGEGVTTTKKFIKR